MKKLLLLTTLLLTIAVSAFAYIEGIAGSITKAGTNSSGDLGCAAHYHGVVHGHYPEPATVSAEVRTVSMFADLSLPFWAGHTQKCILPELTTEHEATGGFNIFLIKRTGQNPDGTDQFQIAKWWTPRNLSPDSDGVLRSTHTLNFTDWWSPNFVGTGPGWYALVSCLVDVELSGDYFGIDWSSQPINDTSYECKVTHDWHPIFVSGEGPDAGGIGDRVKLPGNYTADIF